jgi:hypothetical protein
MQFTFLVLFAATAACVMSGAAAADGSCASEAIDVRSFATKYV